MYTFCHTLYVFMMTKPLGCHLNPVPSCRFKDNHYPEKESIPLNTLTWLFLQFLCSYVYVYAIYTHSYIIIYSFFIFKLMETMKMKEQQWMNIKVMHDKISFLRKQERPCGIVAVWLVYNRTLQYFMWLISFNSNSPKMLTVLPSVFYIWESWDSELRVSKITQ